MLQIQDLHKSYGSVEALNGCTFAAAPGRMLGFLGPNGAGKTTAMRAIFGLVTPDRGSITWNGKEIGPDERMRFGYMPESRGLYPKMKVADQLTYFGRLHGMGGAEAASAAQELLDRLGLADRARDQVEKLSHGNQQRVQLAAALINEPELLVLDEPFSGLDPLGVATLAEVLAEKAHRGTAVVFSSHQLDLVEDLCEDVVIIHRGRVVKTGPVEEIKDSSPVRHLEIELADGMVPGLDGLEEFVTSREGDRVYLQVPAELDVRPLMGGALETGSVRRFVYTTPSLSEIFIEAVS
ncbi:MAG TPA: ATP-binding cassette domain-containing protein [Acidimicrobiia bacterium]|nr:ATP-binding cassette domain-containing protein [Acidimicrobiia bacterium]